MTHERVSYRISLRTSHRSFAFLHATFRAQIAPTSTSNSGSPFGLRKSSENSNMFNSRTINTHSPDVGYEGLTVKDGFSVPRMPKFFPAVLACTVAFQVIMLPFLIARVYSNILGRKVHIEDVFSYLAWCSCLIQAFMTCKNSQFAAKLQQDINVLLPYDDVFNITIVRIVSHANHAYNLAFMFYAVSGGLAKATVRFSHTHHHNLREQTFA